MFYRADLFMPRDVFDLAVVYDHRQADFFKIAPLIAPKVEALSNRIKMLESSGLFESEIQWLEIQWLEILDGGLKVRGQELNICRQCLSEISKRQDKALNINIGIAR